jgi:hypothetical protein
MRADLPFRAFPLSLDIGLHFLQMKTSPKLEAHSCQQQLLVVIVAAQGYATEATKARVLTVAIPVETRQGRNHFRGIRMA